MADKVDFKIPEKIKDIPYITSAGDKETASVIRVGLPVDQIESLDPDRRQVLESLSRAVDGMNPIIATQRGPEVIEVYTALETFQESLPLGSKERLAVGDYLDLISAANSLVDHQGQRVVFPLTPDRIPTEHPVIRRFAEEYSDLTTIPKIVIPGKGLYPEDLTEEEFSSLPEDQRERINSSIIRGSDRSLEVVLNERRFERPLSPVIKNLEEALAKTPADSNLARYMRAALTELKEGSRDARFESDLAWLGNDDSVDFRLRTAEETYVDGLKGIRGGASASLMLVDSRYQGLCRTISDLLPEIEATAPWKYKKMISKAPDLRVVNVLSWSADYDSMPFTTQAQALPNEKKLIDEHGSRLMIYGNIQEAVRKSGVFDLVARAMMTPREIARYGSRMTADLAMKMTIAHEQGHTTGGVVIDKDPNLVFGKEYSIMEEARAELIAMHALPLLARRGVIDSEDVVAGYYCMLQSIGLALRTSPVHHSGSRKMMFNYFVDNGGLVPVETAQGVRYEVNPERMPQVVSDMLGTIGNIKAEGRVSDFTAFKDCYFTKDPKGQEDYFRREIRGLPRGRLLVFPELRGGEILFNPEYRSQRKTLSHSL